MYKTTETICYKSSNTSCKIEFQKISSFGAESITAAINYKDRKEEKQILSNLMTFIHWSSDKSSVSIWIFLKHHIMYQSSLVSISILLYDGSEQTIKGGLN